MRFALALFIFALSFEPIAHAQALPPHAPAPDKDRLGLSCAQILKMTSTDWVAYYGKKTGLIAANMPYDLLNANASYGRCYDARTDALASSLARTGKGPNKAARDEFASFESDLKQFEAKALANAQPANDDQRKSYADLFEKQFRYGFYKEFEERAIKPPAVTRPATSAPGAKSAAPNSAPAAKPSSAAPSGDANTSPHEATSEERAKSDADPMTMAKNRFGKLLEGLPDEQMHDLHRAFGDVVGPHPISEAARLAVYRYAIFILEPPSATPFAPPPF